MELLTRNVIVDPFRTFKVHDNIEVAVFQHLFDDPYVEDDFDELLINPNHLDNESNAPQVPTCLTYVTRGFGQVAETEDELVITFKSDRKTKEPQETAELVEKSLKQILAHLESEPSSVKQGLLFDTPDGFGTSRFTSLLFGPFEIAAFQNLNSDWIEKHGSYLSVIPLTADETTMARYCTGTRVFSLLSKQQNRFPASPIFDASREACVTAQQASAAPETLLGRSDQGTLSCSGVWEPQEKKIHLNIAFEMAEHLQEAFDSIPLEDPMFIQLNTDSEADGHLLWDPSNPRAYARVCKPTVVASEAKKLGGSFLGFVPKQAADTVLIHEDGFLAMLKTDHWTLLRHCLSSGMTCGIRSDNSDGLEIKFQFESLEAEENVHEHDHAHDEPEGDE